jgi:hypothetical protein
VLPNEGGATRLNPSVDNPVHPLNADTPTDVIPEGTDNDCKPAQPWKEDAPMDVTLDGIVRLANPEQP